MTWRIVSPRLGTPGDAFEPRPGVNIFALLEGGFIEPWPDNAPTDEEPAKNRPNKKPKE
jgi:hypothetical protein